MNHMIKMERFTPRECVLLGYSTQRSFENSSRKSDTNSDMDFSDVFGGPPRRYSIQESGTRYSFSEAAMDSEPVDAAVLSQSPWCVVDEKPVFGAEIGNRRTHPGDDFFDDIFKGDDYKSFNSPGRRSSRDFLGSSPDSRVLSPSMTLPPKAEPFSASVPAQFSLPAKVTKTTDYPAFGSTKNRSPFLNKDGISNGISNGHTSSASLSIFSSQATEMQDETRYNRPLYRKSPLSQEVSNSSQESSYETKSDKNNTDSKLKKSESKEVPLNSGQFHFSIYKWAGSGAPLLMSLGGGSKSRFKDRFRTERSSSSNGRIQSDSNGRLPNLEERVISLDRESVSVKVNGCSHHDNSKENKAESGRDIEEVRLKIPEAKLLVSEGNVIPRGEAISMKSTEEESHSRHDTYEKETCLNKGKTLKTEKKPLHEFLNDENQEQGNSAEGKDNNVKITNIANDDANASTALKKNDAKRTNSYRSEVTNDSLKNSETNSGDAFGRSRVKGKVGEFVKMFNQESSEKVKNDIGSQSTIWKQINILGKENGVSNAVNTDVRVHMLNKTYKPEKINILGKENGVRIAVNIDEKVHMLNKTKKPEPSSREDDNFNKNKVKEESHSKISSHKASGLSTNEKNASLFSESIPNNYGPKVQNRDEPLHGYFLVEELSHVEEKVSKTSGESEHIQASNAKIRQWSSGRKGNIRSLLSTLQFVLWPESGWKPVPLVDLIEANAVRKAYQRALLCLHPDKLQQKGAASHQKYIAQQVFEILQEAWDHFNSLGAS